MGKFNLVKKVDLGEFWEGAYINITEPDYNFLKRLTRVDSDNKESSVDEGISVLEDIFVDGKIDGKDVAKEDIKELPIRVINALFDAMWGKPDPNA